VWIYTQSNIRNIIFTWVHYIIKTFETLRQVFFVLCSVRIKWLQALEVISILYCTHNTNLVLETQIMWSAFASENSKNLFVMMELASANPNNEWSVNTDLIPIELACNKASWHSVENAWNIEIYNLKSSSVTCYNFKYNVFITVISKHLRLCWKPSKHACIFRVSVCRQPKNICS
jgi:hypothetical protein